MHNADIRFRIVFDVAIGCNSSNIECQYERSDPVDLTKGIRSPSGWKVHSRNRSSIIQQSRVRHAASPPDSRNVVPAARGADVSHSARRDSNVAILVPFHVILYVTTRFFAQAEGAICLNLPDLRHDDKDRAYGTTLAVSTLYLAPAARPSNYDLRRCIPGPRGCLTLCTLHAQS
jgi:hypothetical protein